MLYIIILSFFFWIFGPSFGWAVLIFGTVYILNREVISIDKPAGTAGTANQKVPEKKVKDKYFDYMFEEAKKEAEREER